MKSKIKVLSDSMSGRGSLPNLQISVFLHDFSILNANLQIMSVFMAGQFKVMSVFVVVYRTWKVHFIFSRALFLIQE